MTARLAPAHPAPRNEAASRSLRLLQTPTPHLPPQPEGLLQIHTAPHRGSFSAVLSQALRAAGLGSRVLVCQLLKGGVDQGIEGSQVLCGRLRWLRPATPLCRSPGGGAGGVDWRSVGRDGGCGLVAVVWFCAIAPGREGLLCSMSPVLHAASGE
jgi:cob(I)alamin adenosyltransferase